MPRLMEKKDWTRAISGFGVRDRVWQEDLSADRDVVPLSLPELGMYRIYLVKIDEKRDSRRTETNCVGYARKSGGIKIGSMKNEIHLPEKFDQEFDGLDGKIASMFAGGAS